MSAHHAGFILALGVIAQLAIAGIWDLVCLLLLDRGDCTVSTYLSRWAHDFPIGVLALGIILGHLIWTQHLPRN
jgi:hypothetical protein